MPGQNQLLVQYEDSLDLSNMGNIRQIDQAVDSGSVAKAQTLCTSMNCTCFIESQYKEFFQVFLNSVAKDTACNTSQLNTLWEIADQCPLTKGEAVFRARVLLRAELDSNIRFDVDCSPDSTSNPKNHRNKTLTFQEKESNSLEFNWRPNPTSSYSILSYDIGNNNQADLILSDMKGRELDSYSLNESKGRMKVDLSSFEEGVYFFRVVKGGKVLKTGKLVRIE